MAEQRQTARQHSTSHTPPPSSPAIEAPDDEALALVAAFYRGLGATPSLTTATMQRRDFAIARQLVQVGATPPEAEGYARQTSGLQGRIAPVDLRSFERERLAWLARHRGEEHRRVDRTGLPPAWLDGATDHPRTASPPLQLEAAPRGPSAAVRASGATAASAHPELAHEHLGHALRAALLARAR
jgi:hypothetical protein